MCVCHIFWDLGPSSVDNNEDDFILCCDFVVLSVRLLQTSPWHTLVDTALEGFHLVMMVVMMMVIVTMIMITMTVRIILYSQMDGVGHEEIGRMSYFETEYLF